MPYIKKCTREWLARRLPEEKWSLIISAASDPGELNFLLTTIINKYLEFNGKNYQNINNVLGALEGAKLEFYRRTVVPYEDEKIKENGDLE